MGFTLIRPRTSRPTIGDPARAAEATQLAREAARAGDLVAIGVATRAISGLA